jgi:hypothetical protein
MTSEQIFALTPEKAQQALDTLKPRSPAPPDKSPAAARERLAGLKSDDGFLSRYFSGELAAQREMQQLLNSAGADRTERLLAGVTDPTRSDVLDGISAHETVAEIGRLREAGIDDASIEQLLRGEPISKFEHAAITEMQRVLHGDADWVKRFLGGDREAVRQQKLITIALLSGHKSEAA